MTAEVALLNKEAVALAADSAVTIGLAGGGQKILPSANKIFSLSRVHPVGIMVYGNAQFMGVPWEILIKSYRRELGVKEFRRLDEYAQDFLRYLREAPGIFTTHYRKEFVQRTVVTMQKAVIEQIDQVVYALFEDASEVTKDQIASTGREIIGALHEQVKARPLLPGIPEGLSKKIKTEMIDWIDEVINALFENFPLSKKSKSQLVDLATWSLTKMPLTEQRAGIVFAGFGRDDVFPVLRSFWSDGLIFETLRCVDHHKHDVSESEAAIIPFAQSEMVGAFMEGVDSSYQTCIEVDLVEAFNAFAEAAANQDCIPEDERPGYLEVLSRVNAEIIKEFKEHARKFRKDKFADPVLDITAMLPKDELAAMAESLVNLTSFRRKISRDAETVGGPIDVAVISKGDGFIWIQRKHYFSPALNPQFFATQYPGGSNASSENDGC